MSTVDAASEARRPPEVPWVESPGLEAHLAACEAPQAHKRAARDLARDGFAVLDFEDARVPELCDQAVADLKVYHDDETANRVQDAWCVSDAIRTLAAHPEVKAFLRLAYGRAPFPFQTLNFKRGSQQHFHADTIHFHSEPAKFMCGVWLALEDVAEDAGPLLYCPGSQALPVLSMRDAGVNDPAPTSEHYNRQYVPMIARLIKERGLEVRPALLEKGRALVWAANLIHGGAPITRPGASRQSLVTHYYFEGCAYFTPMESDLEAGRLRLRLPNDIGSGRMRWPTRNGRPLWPGWRPFTGALRQRVRPRPTVYRDGG